MQNRPLKDLKLHPVFEFFQNQSKGEFPPIPDLLERIRPGDMPVQVTTDNTVVSGIGLVNIAVHKGLKAVKAKEVPFDSGSPQALILCLREIARCTPLSLNEAARVKHNYSKVVSSMEDQDAGQIPELQVHGLIDGLFRLYREGSETGGIPNFQALKLSRDIPPEIQEAAAESIAKNPLRALECVRNIGENKPAKQAGIGEKRPEEPATPQVLVDRLLQDPAAREALFNRLTDLVPHPLEALQFRQITAGIAFKKEKEKKQKA